MSLSNGEKLLSTKSIGRFLTAILFISLTIVVYVKRSSIYYEWLIWSLGRSNIFSHSHGPGNAATQIELDTKEAMLFIVSHLNNDRELFYSDWGGSMPQGVTKMMEFEELNPDLAPDPIADKFTVGDYVFHRLRERSCCQPN